MLGTQDYGAPLVTISRIQIKAYLVPQKRISGQKKKKEKKSEQISSRNKNKQKTLTR